MSGAVVLQAEDLHTYYGKSHILHGVSLEVREGEIVTLLGRNGAGKTTTLRSLVGLTHPREGAVRVFGHATTDWSPFRVAGIGVGYVPEGRRIFANLTVAENLLVPVDRPGPWTIPRIYELFPRLAQRKSNRGRQLSGGEQEMLSIARALLLNPKLLSLDEPSQGLAPLIVKEVFPNRSADAERGHFRFCWWSRTCGWRWRLPTRRLYWKMGRLFIRAAQRNSGLTRSAFRHRPVRPPRSGIWTRCCRHRTELGKR